MNVRLKVYVSISEREMEMHLGKVTREYAEQKQERMKRETRQQSRLKSILF